MVHFPTIDRLIELEIPAMIVVGVKDPLISKERMKSALDVLPNLTLVFHTGAAHAVNYSHPGELASVARDFIEGRPIDIEQAGNEIVVVGVGSQVEHIV
jgi:pimeloyl-ACP methyl ester carboxylesterase